MDLADRLAEAASGLLERVEAMPPSDETLELAQAVEALSRAAVAAAGVPEGLGGPSLRDVRDELAARFYEFEANDSRTMTGAFAAERVTAWINELCGR